MTNIADTIDSISNDMLLHVIRNSNEFTWNFFAMKIILTRLKLKISMTEGDCGKSILSECCEELRNLLKKSVNVPNSQADLRQILSIVNV